jgi:hypothetical protein
MEGPFRDPGIPDGERTTYRGMVGGAEAGSGEMTIFQVQHDGHPAYRQETSIRAPGGVVYTGAVTLRRRGESVHAEDYRLETVQEPEGRISLEEARFRRVRPLTWDAETAPYPRDLVPLLAGPVLLRGLEWEAGARRTFSAWLANSVHWEAEAEVGRREDVPVPAGTFAAWPVRLRPVLEQVDRTLDKLVAGLMPALVMHFAAEPPHRFLRFAFPTGPFRTSPPGLIEATEL